MLRGAVLVVVTTGMAGADPGPQDGSPGAYFGGVAELEFNLSDDFTDELLGGRADVRAGFLNQSSGTVQLGFEIGIDAYDIAGAPRLTAWQAVGYAVTSAGTFSIGAPLAAEADFGPETVFDRTVINRILLIEDRPTPESVILDFADPVAGLRYDGQFGPVSVAVSAHEFIQADDLSAYSAAASFEGSFFTLTGQAGLVDGPADRTQTFSLAAESQYGPVGGAVEILSIEGDQYIYTIEGSYAVDDRFAVAVGLQELDLDRGGADTSWLVEAQYGFATGAFISATAGRTLGNGEAAVGIGLEF